MWRVYQPVDVTFGEGKVKDIDEVLERLGVKRAFIISDPFLASNGTAEKVMNYSDGRIVGFSGEVEPEASVSDVNKNVAKARELNADCIIGLGGGSSMDCTKSVSICVKQNLKAEDILYGAKNLDSLPIVLIPTTAGTGSEVTQGAGLIDKEKGIHGGIDGKFATAAIVDPELTYTMPRSVTINSGLDALGHSLDTLDSKTLHPYAKQLAVYAAKEIFENIEKVVKNPDDKEARRNMSEASLVAGLACSQVTLSGSHACSMGLSGMLHIPHGAAVAFTLDKWVRLNAKANPKINDYAKEIGFDDAEAMADKIVELRKEFGMPLKLSDMGGTEDMIKPLAKAAASNFFGWMESNCAPQTEEQMEEFYKDLL